MKTQITCGSHTVKDILFDKISTCVYTGFFETVRLYPRIIRTLIKHLYNNGSWKKCPDQFTIANRLRILVRMNRHPTKYVSILPDEFCLSRQMVTPDNVSAFLVKNLSVFTSTLSFWKFKNCLIEIRLFLESRLTCYCLCPVFVDIFVIELFDIHRKHDILLD